MKLKEWRKKRNLSQNDLSLALEAFVKAKCGEAPKRVKQTTLGYWERGTLPRRFWLGIITEYTKGQVTADDFVDDPISIKTQPEERV